jgi:nucleoside-diphosphate-sugar epimerase
VDAADRGLPEVACWGSGNATREFIHARDAVRGILEAALHYDEDEPLNIGSQEEVSIRRLTEIIAAAAGYRGRIFWDTSKPEGRPRVCLDSSRMRALLPPWQLLDLEHGVAETVRWFRASGHGFDN